MSVRKCWKNKVLLCDFFANWAYFAKVQNLKGICRLGLISGAHPNVAIGLVELSMILLIPVVLYVLKPLWRIGRRPCAHVWLRCCLKFSGFVVFSGYSLGSTKVWHTHYPLSLENCYCFFYSVKRGRHLPEGSDPPAALEHLTSPQNWEKQKQKSWGL